MDPILCPALLLQLTLVCPEWEPLTPERSHPWQGAPAASLERALPICSRRIAQTLSPAGLGRGYLITEPFPTDTISTEGFRLPLAHLYSHKTPFTPIIEPPATKDL